MAEQDILSIDADIKAKFREEEKKLPEYRERLESIEKALHVGDLSQRAHQDLISHKSKLTYKIKDISNRSTEYFYIMETLEYIEKFKKILKTPMKMSFMGKKINNNAEKSKVIIKYIELANKYTHIVDKSPSKEHKIVCDNCSNKKSFEIIEESIYICVECGSEQKILSHTSSFNDQTRVNMSAKYTYDRKTHFRDCINQYQGKQNSTIDQKVYDDLEDQFRNHHLLVETKGKNTLREIKFQNINKRHVMMFLNELGYAKHYENLNLIHYTFTGIAPDDISHIEDKLLDDFDQLTDLYDKRFKHEKKIRRKNFINTQYVLYQLLNRHKHQCKKEDFNILKTVDRKSFHDDICMVLFNELGWNFTPYF